ncbi:MAG: hypothetical protein DSY79_12780 [Chloroflexi bacterium]|nr:MAG: hypothetical protein DSY79_12780 [Chloroflexota bacterium]
MDALVRAIDGRHGSLVTRCALQVASLVFVRPGKVRDAKWTDIHLERAGWRIHVAKMKRDHIVSLSDQAIHILDSNLAVCMQQIPASAFAESGLSPPLARFRSSGKRSNRRYAYASTIEL